MNVNNINQLIEDIFKETGQKVEVNDPIVSAALIQSRIIKNATLELKETLSNEISKQAIDTFKHDISSIKRELIEMSNNHRQELEKISNNVVNNIKNELNNNVITVSNIINNNLFYLALFGSFCGMMGGLIFWLAKNFIG